MAPPPKGSRFGGVLHDVQDGHPPLPKQGKTPQISFPIDAELRRLLDRVVHHKGKRFTQKSWLAEVVRKAVLADPDSNKPVPGEDD